MFIKKCLYGNEEKKISKLKLSGGSGTWFRGIQPWRFYQSYFIIVKFGDNQVKYLVHCSSSGDAGFLYQLDKPSYPIFLRASEVPSRLMCLRTLHALSVDMFIVCHFI